MLIAVVSMFALRVTLQKREADGDLKKVGRASLFVTVTLVFTFTLKLTFTLTCAFTFTLTSLTFILTQTVCGV